MSTNSSISSSLSPLDEERPHRYGHFFAIAFGISIFFTCIFYSTWWRRCLSCKNNTYHNSDYSKDGEDDDKEKRIEVRTTDADVLDHRQHRRSTNRTTIEGSVRRVSWWNGCVQFGDSSDVAPQSFSQSKQDDSLQLCLPFYSKYCTTTKEHNIPSSLSSGNLKSTGKIQDIETATSIIEVETGKSKTKSANEGCNKESSIRRGTGRFDYVRGMGLRFDEQPEERRYDRKTTSATDKPNTETLSLPA